MATCTNCSQEIPEGLLTGSEVYKALQDQSLLWRLEGEQKGLSVKVRDKNYQIEVLGKNEKRAGGNYGEYDQGETYDTWVAFKLDGDFFKLRGSEDSYGSNTWIDVIRVKAVTKTITVFE